MVASPSAKDMDDAEARLTHQSSAEAMFYCLAWLTPKACRFEG